MSATLTRLVPLLLASLALAACSGDDSPSQASTTPRASTTPPTSAPTTPKATTTPMGHTYISTEVEGTPIPGDGPLTLIFFGDRVSAYAGCNTTSGSVTLDGDTLRVGSLASTLIGCAEPQAGSDQWVNTLLTSGPTWRLEGSTLTLRSPDRTVTLRDKKVATPDKPLQGTEWVVNGTISRDAHTSSQTISEVRPTLVIAEDGTVSGSTGCNRITGTATVDPSGSPIVFRVATTRMACPAEVMEVEAAVLATLDGTATADIDADILTLRNENGSGLSLTAR